MDLAQFLGFLFLVDLLGPLDQGQDIAHSEDPPGQPVGVKPLVFDVA